MTNAIANKIKGCHKASLTHARAAGELLATVSAKMPYQDFIAFADEKCGLSEATANNYLLFFKRWKWKKKIKLLLS